MTAAASSADDGPAPFGSWVALGPASSGPIAVVDGLGGVHEHTRRLVLRWAVHAGDGWSEPGHDGVRVVQQGRAGAAVVETRVRVPSGELIHRCFAVVTGERPSVVVELENASAVPVAVALGLHRSSLLGGDGGSTPALTAEAASVLADGEPVLFLDRPPAAPARADAPDHLPVVVPVTHRSTARVLVAGPGAGWGREAIPSGERVVAGWQAHLVRGARLRADEPLADESWSTAVAGLLTATAIEHVPPPPGVTRWVAADECRVAGALALAGFAAEAGPVLGSVLESCQAGPLGPSVADEVAVLQAVTAHGRVSGDLRLVDTFLVDLVAAADRVLRAGGRRRPRLARRRPSPHPVPGGRSAVLGLAAAIAALGQPEAAAELAGAVGDDPEPGRSGPVLQAALERVDRIRRRNLRWPSEVDDAGRCVAGAGDDPRRAAEVVALVRAALVDDTPPPGRADTAPVVAVLPRLLPIWWRRGLEVFGMPTAAGRLSFGVRWHGTRPALLWDLEPVAGVVGEDVVLRCPGLDPSWEGRGVTGDALLAATAEPGA